MKKQILLSPWGGAFYIYEGEGTGGAILSSGVYKSLPAGWQTFQLTSPVRLTSGEKYTFRLSSSHWAISVVNDPYPGGRSSLSASRDFTFRSYVAEAIPNITMVVTEHWVGGLRL